jgi:hypothetical protein
MPRQKRKDRYPPILKPPQVHLYPLEEGKFYETRLRVRYPNIAAPFEVTIQGQGNKIPSDRELERGWGPEQKEKGLYETQAHHDIAKLIIHGLTRKFRERVLVNKRTRTLDNSKVQRLQEFILDAWKELRELEANTPRFFIYDSRYKDERKPKKVAEGKQRIESAELVVCPEAGLKTVVIHKDLFNGHEWQRLSIIDLMDVTYNAFGTKTLIDDYFHLKRYSPRDKRNKIKLKEYYVLGDPK